MVLTRAFRHAARGIAYAGKGDTKSARTEQTAYLEAGKLVPADHLCNISKRDVAAGACQGAPKGRFDGNRVAREIG
jgi:hypothetical protein